MSSPAPSTSPRTPQEHLAAPGWFHRRHHSPRSGPRTRGGAKQLYGVDQRHHRDSRLSPPGGDAQKPLRSAGLGYSKRQARPPKGDRSHREHAGESNPRREVHPSANGVGSVSIRLEPAGRIGVRSTCDSTLSPEAGEGAIPSNRGPGHRRNEAAWGRAPGNKPRSTRSPLSPQLGQQFPPPVRCLTCHPIMCVSLQGFWFALTTPGTSWTAVCFHSFPSRGICLWPSPRQELLGTAVCSLFSLQGFFAFTTPGTLGSKAICLHHR